MNEIEIVKDRWESEMSGPLWILIEENCPKEKIFFFQKNGASLKFVKRAKDKVLKKYFSDKKIVVYFDKLEYEKIFGQDKQDEYGEDVIIYNTYEEYLKSNSHPSKL